MLKGIPSSFPNATSFIPQDLGLNTVDSTTSMLNVLISCWNKTSNTQLKCFKWGWQIEYQMISATNERTKRHSFRYCWWFRNPFPTNRLDGAKTLGFQRFQPQLVTSSDPKMCHLKVPSVRYASRRGFANLARPEEPKGTVRWPSGWDHPPFFCHEVRPFGKENIPSWLTITMVINHLLNGMILQVWNAVGRNL